MTAGARPASAPSAVHCRGLRNIARIALAIRFTVVSWPATSSRTQVDDDLLLGQLVAGLLDRGQARHQVIAGLRPSPLDQTVEVFAQPYGRLDALLNPSDGSR